MKCRGQGRRVGDVAVVGGLATDLRDIPLAAPLTTCVDTVKPTTKHAAHHPASEAGRDIGPAEHDMLNAKLVQVRNAA